MIKHKSILIVIIGIWILSSSLYGEINNPADRYAIETAGGAIGEAGGICLAGQSLSNAGFAAMGVAPYYIYGLGIPLGTAMGVSTASYLSGKGFKFIESLTGAYLGEIITWGIFTLFTDMHVGLLFYAVTLIPPIITSVYLCESSD